MRPMCWSTRSACLATIVVVGLLAVGCNRREANMRKQPKYKPLEPSEFFEDGRSSRPLVDGTVDRDHLRLDEHYYTGKVNGALADTFPPGFPTSGPELEAKLRRGQERFDIFCAACHGRLGDGNGMIVQRGFPKPPSYHEAKLRNAPIGHFFNVMTVGIGAMYDYSARISPDDRWAIAAYIRALQLSQNATAADIAATQSGAEKAGGLR